MKIADVMTSTVVSVTPSTHYKDAVEQLVAAGVSGAPVIDETGRLVGIVTEADLVSKPAFGVRHSRALAVLADVLSGREHHWAAKSAGHTMADVMSTDVETCAPTDDVGHVARRMLDRGVKRLPVVRGDQVVGIVSRRDVLRVLVRPDDAIQTDVEHRLQHDPNRPDDAHVHCAVQEGVVTLSGDVRYEWDIPVVISFARGVEGVIDVVDHLHNREPDPRQPSVYGGHFRA
jgi:CBS domain-containing protein